MAAYENAFQFEPDNNVTWTYLNKAKKKFAKENEKRRIKEDEVFDKQTRERDEAYDAQTREREYNRIREDEAYEAQTRDRDRNGDGHAYDYGHDDGLSVTDTVDLANMALSVADNAKDLSTSVYGQNHEEGLYDASLESPINSDAMGGVHAAIEHDRVRFQENRRREEEDEMDDSDPDFDEALRLQEGAGIKLVNKQYRQAVEDFSAALFLVPDDDNLTPQLYVGRAHALNGLERHEGALNDAMMALGRDPDLGDAHLVLARTYFYLKDYREAEQSFENALECLGNISPLDQIYYKKAHELAPESSIDHDDDGSFSQSFSVSRQSASKPVPKLQPPRFVSRQQQLSATTNVPPLPKKWAKTLSGSERLETLKVGPERKVTFLSRAMGVKLNRGPDGIVRILSVTLGSDVSRQGDLYVGDVIREAAGVDLRRPLTNVMWSDTVALLKIAPRPLLVKVAMELSKKLPPVQKEFDLAKREADEQNKALQTPREMRSRRPDMMSPPSCTGGTEAVSETAGMITEMEETLDAVEGEGVKSDEVENERDNSIEGETTGEIPSLLDDEAESQSSEKEEVLNDSTSIEINEGKIESGEDSAANLAVIEDRQNNEGSGDTGADVPASTEGIIKEDEGTEEECADGIVKEEDKTDADEDQLPQSRSTTIGGGGTTSGSALKIIFPRPSTASGPSHGDYTNASWKAEESIRKLGFCGEVSRLEQGRFFWSNEQFVKRTMILYENPSLLVIAREPTSAAEVRGVLRTLDEPGQLPTETDGNLVKGFLFAESVIDLKTCKLRLSMLTTPTSVVSEKREKSPEANGDPNRSIDCRRMSCFEIITPAENILISAMKNDETGNVPEIKLTDSTRSTFSTTSRWESEISQALLSAHDALCEDGTELTWRHQIILGTLHSHVVSGNYALLELSLAGKGSPHAPYKGVDARDGVGLTPLHYACFRRSHKAVSILLKAGADCSLPTIKENKTPCHICAAHLDEKSLSIILSCSEPNRADPNALDGKEETPMYVALVRGRSPVEGRNPNMCLKSLEAWGGQICVSESEDASKLNPVCALSTDWDGKTLDLVFQIYKYRYPIVGEAACGYGRSLGAIFQYPLHACLVSLRKKIATISEGSRAKVFSQGIEDITR